MNARACCRVLGLAVARIAVAAESEQLAARLGPGLATSGSSWSQAGLLCPSGSASFLMPSRALHAGIARMPSVACEQLPPQLRPGLVQERLALRPCFQGLRTAIGPEKAPLLGVTVWALERVSARLQRDGPGRAQHPGPLIGWRSTCLPAVPTPTPAAQK